MYNPNEDINISIEKNEGLVHQVLKKYFPTFSIDEDLIQAGRIGLWRAIRDFDENKGYTLSTYATYCIKSNIYMELTYRKRHHNSVLETSFDEIIENLTEDIEKTPHVESIFGFDSYDNLNRIDLKVDIEKLSEPQKELCGLIASGYTQMEIGEIYGITYQAVQNRLKTIKRKLERN